MKSPLSMKAFARHFKGNTANKRQMAAHQPETHEHGSTPEETGYVSFTFTRDGELIPVDQHAVDKK